MLEEAYKLTGPALLLAGPGTGKTTNLAKRIKYLVENIEIEPEMITVATFTSLATENMLHKISNPNEEEFFIPNDKQPKRICTLHSLGFNIIKEVSEDFGLSNNIEVIFSSKTQDLLSEDAANILGYSIDEANEMLKCRRHGECQKSSKKICKICKKYLQILRSCNAIDFDDQIFLAVEVLKKNEEILKKYQRCCTHLLVDEYQDINKGQFELIDLLSINSREGLFVVGDDDQSIYSWRGGSPKYIRNFVEQFGPDSNVKILNESYRCPKIILENAFEVVKKYDRDHIDKGVFEYKTIDKGKLEIHNVPSEIKEAKIIASIVERIHPLEVLILIPHRGYSYPIIKELQKTQSGYKAILQSPGEGVPLISKINRWLQNNNESLNFRDCLEAFLNSPISGIPSKRSKKPEKLLKRAETLKLIGLLWEKLINREHKTLYEVFQEEGEYTEFFKNASDVFTRLKENLDKKDLEGITDTIRDFGIWKKTKSFFEELDQWYELYSLLENQNKVANVLITTFQSAKGLEADVVCMVGIEEGTIPRKGINREKIAEQSRLMFVSMTRAKRELHIFHARKRSPKVLFRDIYKNKGKPDIRPSCYIECLSKDFKIYHKA